MMETYTAKEAISMVNTGDNVFIHGAAMTPTLLVQALCDHCIEKEINIIHIHTQGTAEYGNEDDDRFTTHCCFVGSNIRKAVNQSQRVNYIPVFLSDIHKVLTSGDLRVDVALLRVSYPDKHGYCSLGTSVDVALPAFRTASKVIVEFNENVPRVYGDGFIHVKDISCAIDSKEPMHQGHVALLTKEEKQIGINVANLIEDGATLQMGIGGMPDAVLAQLGSHKALGVHTEMFSDGILPLIESGVITNEHKKVLPGKIVSSFVVGTQRLYDFIDNNPIIALKEASFTNDTAIIRENPKVVAINSAIEIDITGQVCADSIGTFQYSGVGGQMDFIRGAALSPGGKPIIALTSTTRKGESKVVPMLKPGASVTTTRAHVHWVVTEYGAVNLFGKDLVTRARLLTSIAHPDHREELFQDMYDRYHLKSHSFAYNID